MQSVLSYAGHQLSQKFLLFRGPSPLAPYDPGGMNSGITVEGGKK